MPRRSPCWLLPCLVAAAADASAGEPPATVRIWAATRLDLTSREVTDEAGARWLEVEGRLTADRGEAVGGAELRFDRPGDSERCSTDPAGRCRVRLRAPTEGDPWIARFDGAERLRPCAAPVPTAALRPSAGHAWVVLLPLLLAGGGTLAALAIAGARRLAPRWRDWLARRRRRATGRQARREDSERPGSIGPRRIRVLDAFRLRPIDGARLSSRTDPGALPTTTDADGWADLPGAPESVVVDAPGYLPGAPAAPPTAAGEEPPERLDLLRARDALVVVLEAHVGPDGRPAGAWPESVLRIARRALPPAEADRVARLCYRRPGPPDPAERQLVEQLTDRAVAGTPGRLPSSREVLEALASERPALVEPARPRRPAVPGPSSGDASGSPA